jgi:hypothetical protein
MFLRNVGWLSTDYTHYISEDRLVPFKSFTIKTFKLIKKWWAGYVVRIEKIEKCIENFGSSPADFSTLKMEALRSAETSVHTRSTRRHIPEDGILLSHRCENLKSYIIYVIFTLVQYVLSTLNSKKKLNSVACSPQANYTDRTAAACRPS